PDPRTPPGGLFANPLACSDAGTRFPVSQIRKPRIPHCPQAPALPRSQSSKAVRIAQHFVSWAERVHLRDDLLRLVDGLTVILWHHPVPSALVGPEDVGPEDQGMVRWPE